MKDFDFGRSLKNDDTLHCSYYILAAISIDIYWNTSGRVRCVVLVALDSSSIILSPFI